MATHGKQLVVHGLDSGIARELKREDFPGIDVQRGVGLGKFGVLGTGPNTPCAGPPGLPWLCNPIWRYRSGTPTRRS